MKILYLMPYSPVPPIFGGALREYYVLKSLAGAHEVTALAYGTDEELKLFNKDFGDLVEEVHMVRPTWKHRYKRIAQAYTLCTFRSHFYNTFHSVHMQRKIDELLASGSYDAVHCEFGIMGSFTFREDLIRIVDNHNVEYENFRRMQEKIRSPFRKWFYHREYKKTYKEEIRTLKEQDVFFSTSGSDREIFRKDIPDMPNYVVPNGVDTCYFRPSQWYKTEPHTMVFTGMMGYIPNNDGMLWFLNEIFPRVLAQIPDAKIYIVGSQPAGELRQYSSDRVIVTGYVDDVRPFVWRSDVFVVPLRIGSGTRLKVVEALAMKKPVVSTCLGCEGIDVQQGKSILIEDEPEAFANSIVRLMKNKKLREKLARNGYNLVKENYDWTVVGRKMLDIYKLLEEKGQARKHPVKSLESIKT